MINDLIIERYESCDMITDKLRYHLFFLQKKIYLASKESNLSLVHSLQKLLIASCSIKLLASEQMRRSLNLDPITLLDTNNLHDSLNSLSISFTENIEKKLVQWSIMAEWKPKIEHKFIARPSQLGMHFLSSSKSMLLKYTKVMPYYYFKRQIVVPLRHLDSRLVTTKLKSIPWIHTRIKNWIDGQAIEEHVNYLLDNRNRAFSCRQYSSLHRIICQILGNGFKWISFRQIQCKSLDLLQRSILLTSRNEHLHVSKDLKSLEGIRQTVFNFFNALDLHSSSTKLKLLDNIEIGGLLVSTVRNKTITIQPSSYCHNDLIASIRGILFHKNKWQQTRASTNLPIAIALRRIQLKMYCWNVYYKLCLSKSVVAEVNSMIDKILYRWYKKTKSNSS